MRRTRGLVWLQLIIGWLPVWALYATLMLTAHPGVRPFHAIMISLRAIGVAALLGLGANRLTERFPWPHPFQARFVGIHLVGAVLYAVAWVALISALEGLLRGQLVMVSTPNGVMPFLVLGVWLYVMVTGVTYATRATERAAAAEALAARSQLAALRAQLNPHFLFNALHTVVQLIPREPRRAAEAAEQVAGLLRTTIEEERDLVPLAEELALVERYLDIERIRFGERLLVEVSLPHDLEQVLIPSFALQTLVENAVRHGAAPRIEPTTVSVSASRLGHALVLTVRDNGAGGPGDARPGSGLARLRERVAVLFGGRARLDTHGLAGQGFTASLTTPLLTEAE